MNLSAERSVSTPSLLAVIVLYKMRLEDSIALRTLREAAHTLSAPLSLQILVYDNSPAMQIGEFPQDLLYIRSEQNLGLAAAYNEACRIAREIPADWLLTLDQDTTIPPHFLSKLAPILDRIAGDARVAAVVPRLVEGERTLSPHWFACDIFRRLFPTAFTGIPERSVYAFNSGSTFRVTALEQIGGYNELFWLDYSDAYLFRQFHFHGFRMFVAGDLILQHELSVLNASTRMSDARFQNIVEAGCAFFDTMRGPVSGVAFTLGLVKSYIGNLVRHKPATYRRVLVAMLKLRLFHRKAYRLRRFQKQRAGQG